MVKKVLLSEGITFEQPPEMKIKSCDVLVKVVTFRFQDQQVLGPCVPGAGRTVWLEHIGRDGQW